MIRLLSLTLALFTLAACDAADPDDDAPPIPQSVAGTWEGAITHANPALDGTLVLSITQVDRAITGQARWTFSGRTITGSLLGTVPANGPVTYTLNFGNDGRYLHDMTLDGRTLRGTWVSERTAGVNGTSTLTRN